MDVYAAETELRPEVLRQHDRELAFEAMADQPTAPTFLDDIRAFIASYVITCSIDELDGVTGLLESTGIPEAETRELRERVDRVVSFGTEQGSESNRIDERFNIAKEVCQLINHTQSFTLSQLIVQNAELDPAYSMPLVNLFEGDDESHQSVSHPSRDAPQGNGVVSDLASSEEPAARLAAKLRSGKNELATITAQASCREADPEIFFPEKGGSTKEAKRVCARCPVISKCLQFALKHEEPFGIWGGLSERERRARLRKIQARQVA